MYERRAGHGRAFWAAAAGHVTGSVIVAVAARGWSGQPIPSGGAEHGHGVDGHRTSLGVPHHGPATGNSIPWSIAVFALPLHHQKADWGHIVAVPTGYAIDRVRRLRPSLALFGVLAAVTAVLTSFGPAAVDATADTLRFGDTGASVPSAPGQPHGTVTEFTYEAALLEHRPETGRRPPRLLAGSRRSVFLHDPRRLERLARRSVRRDEQARASAPRGPWPFASFDGFVDPAAGWWDAPASERWRPPFTTGRRWLASF